MIGNQATTRLLSGSGVQRMCDSCEEEQRREVQRKPINGREPCGRARSRIVCRRLARRRAAAAARDTRALRAAVWKRLQRSTRPHRHSCRAGGVRDSRTCVHHRRGHLLRIWTIPTPHVYRRPSPDARADTRGATARNRRPRPAAPTGRSTGTSPPGFTSIRLRLHDQSRRRKAAGLRGLLFQGPGRKTMFVARAEGSLQDSGRGLRQEEEKEAEGKGRCLRLRIQARDNKGVRRTVLSGGSHDPQSDSVLHERSHRHSLPDSILLPSGNDTGRSSQGVRDTTSTHAGSHLPARTRRRPRESAAVSRWFLAETRASTRRRPRRSRVRCRCRSRCSSRRTSHR